MESPAGATVITQEPVVSSGRATPVISNQSNAAKSVPEKDTNEDMDREKLKAILERRRKMEEEGVVLYDNLPKGKQAQSTLDAEVQSKLDRRRALSDDGIMFEEGAQRRGSTKGAALDAEVRSKLDRRRCLSDDGVVLTDEVERRATTRREELRSFQMSNDLQAIMARRRQVADAESKES